jgi:Zn-dependent peptidase ImmA (M78 family)
LFNASRLALARRRRGLTKRKLSELAGVTARSLTGFESGLEPSPRTVERLANALGFPASFFFASDLEEVPEEAVSFRALSKMTASKRHAALGAGALALALNDWIESRFRLPQAEVPKLGPGIDAETAAEVVRAEWQLGELPIRNMIHLLEAKGVRVFSLAEASREVDAFSFWRQETPFVFLNTQKSAEHGRFDAAHELGHLVLHWHHSAPQGREAEHEAHLFASAFLMPRAAIVSSAPRFAALNEIMGHKRRWRVSVAAFIYRLRGLGLLSEWHYRSLSVELARRGYRTQEPHGVEQETSQVLNKVFAMLRREGTTRAEIALALSLHPRDLDDLVFGLAMLPVDGSRRQQGPRSDARRPLRLVHRAD